MAANQGSMWNEYVDGEPWPKGTERWKQWKKAQGLEWPKLYPIAPLDGQFQTNNDDELTV